MGAVFDTETARRLVGAIADACANIRPDSIRKSSLSWFGTFRVPARLWQCFSQYACWLEPAIYNEWIRLMQSWCHEYDTSVYANVFDWVDRNRDTRQVRERINRMAADGQPLSCVWSNKRLRMDRYAVDHCFPWSRWLNNDLWNLMPSTAAVNQAKGDKLPSASLLKESRSNILNWWESAYLDDEGLERQFFIEAEAALPLLSQEDRSLVDTFHAMEFQRARLRASQQLAEWNLGQG